MMSLIITILQFVENQLSESSTGLIPSNDSDPGTTITARDPIANGDGGLPRKPRSRSQLSRSAISVEAQLLRRRSSAVVSSITTSEVLMIVCVAS